MNRFVRVLRRVVVCALASVAVSADATVLVVPSQQTPTIASALAIAANADTIDVLPGTYAEHGLVMNHPGTLRGVAGATETIIDAEGLDRVISIEANTCDIEGLTITHGAAGSGAGIYAPIAPLLVIRNCVITDNHATSLGGGIRFGIGIGQFPLSIHDTVLSQNSANVGGALYTNDVVLTMERCVLQENEGVGGAGFLAETTGVVSECLFIDNARGLELLNSWLLDVVDCTFFRNAGTAIGNANGQISRSIFAFNTGGPVVTCVGSAAFSCCDFFGNSGGDSFCGTDSGGNFSLDPLLCDSASGDFRLHEDSPCLPGQHPSGTDCGGTIGALDVGCGDATHVGESVKSLTWGQVKAGFR